MFLFDPTWFLLMLPPFIFMIYAQVKVLLAFRKYSRVANMHHISGARAAEILLRSSGLDMCPFRSGPLPSCSVS